MLRPLLLLPAVLLAAGAFAGEKAIKMSALPPAVQTAIQQQTQGATIKNLVKEVDKGKTFYEVETTRDGRHLDLTFDTAGALVLVEEEVALASIPAPARAAIEKQAAGRKILRVETLTKGQSVTYEAAFKKGVKTSEVVVTPDGSLVK